MKCYHTYLEYIISSVNCYHRAMPRLGEGRGTSTAVHFSKAVFTLKQEDTSTSAQITLCVHVNHIVCCTLTN